MALHLPIGPLKPALDWSWYRDANPVPTSPLADDRATVYIISYLSEPALTMSSPISCMWSTLPLWPWNECFIFPVVESIIRTLLSAQPVIIRFPCKYTHGINNTGINAILRNEKIPFQNMASNAFQELTYIKIRYILLCQDSQSIHIS